MALTAKQSKFVSEYMVDLNATQAAIRAGYKEMNAGATGAENLKKPDIAKAIAAAQENYATASGVTIHSVITKLQEVSNASCSVYLKNPMNAAAAAAAYKGLELLGKHVGAFVELQKINITSEVDVDAIRERILKTAVAKPSDP